VIEHEKILTKLTRQVTPDLVAARPQRASLGQASRRRTDTGISRDDDPAQTQPRRPSLGPALYRSVIVRMQFHEPTKAYVARRTAEGKTKREIIRCLKRLLAREIWTLMRPFREAATTTGIAT